MKSALAKSGCCLSLFFLLGTLSVIEADDIGVTIARKTNDLRNVIITKEYFTRAGQTNLVRSTTTSNGVLKSRSHFFYHDGTRVAEHITHPMHGYSLVNTHAGFALGFTTMSNVLVDVTLTDKNENILDWFVATNNVLTPVPTGELRKMMSDAQKQELRRQDNEQQR